MVFDKTALTRKSVDVDDFCFLQKASFHLVEVRAFGEEFGECFKVMYHQPMPFSTVPSRSKSYVRI